MNAKSDSAREHSRGPHYVTDAHSGLEEISNDDDIWSNGKSRHASAEQASN